MCKNILHHFLLFFGIFFRRYFFMEKSLPDAPVHFPFELDPCFTVKKLEYADYLRERDTFGMTDSKLALFKSLLEENGRYEEYGIFLDGRAVYKCGIDLKGLSVPGNYLNLALKDDAVVFEDDFCIPSMRRKGLNTYMNVFRQNRAIALGKKRAFSSILTLNKPSWKTFLNCGFHIAFKYFVFDVTVRKSDFCAKFS